MKKININYCSKEELITIVHVGIKRAEEIIKLRPFKDIYEISNVKGLGKKRMQDILEQGIISTKI
jgi:DNA uptake protein ComE-like DNA-binding protein